jgi:hypothetical protein
MLQNGQVIPKFIQINQLLLTPGFPVEDLKRYLDFCHYCFEDYEQWLAFLNGNDRIHPSSSILFHENVKDLYQIIKNLKLPFLSDANFFVKFYTQQPEMIITWLENKSWDSFFTNNVFAQIFSSFLQVITNRKENQKSDMEQLRSRTILILRNKAEAYLDHKIQRFWQIIESSTDKNISFPHVFNCYDPEIQNIKHFEPLNPKLRLDTYLDWTYPNIFFQWIFPDRKNQIMLYCTQSPLYLKIIMYYKSRIKVTDWFDFLMTIGENTQKSDQRIAMPQLKAFFFPHQVRKDYKTLHELIWKGFLSDLFLGRSKSGYLDKIRINFSKSRALYITLVENIDKFTNLTYLSQILGVFPKSYKKLLLKCFNKEQDVKRRAKYQKLQRIIKFGPKKRVKHNWNTKALISIGSKNYSIFDHSGEPWFF